MISPATTEETTTVLTTVSATTETTASVMTLADAVLYGDFIGNDYSPTYNLYSGTTTVSYRIMLAAGSDDYSWTYNYTAEIDGEVLCEEAGLTTDNRTECFIEITDDSGLPLGHLILTVTDENGQTVSVGECDLANETEAVRLSRPEDLQVEFDENGSCAIPRTDLIFTIPEGFEEANRLYGEALRRSGDRDFADSFIFDICDDNGYEIGLTYLGDLDFQSPRTINAVSSAVENRVIDIDQQNRAREAYVMPYEMDGRQCDAYIIELPLENGGTMYYTVFPVGNRDIAYVIVAITDSSCPPQTVLGTVTASE